MQEVAGPWVPWTTLAVCNTDISKLPWLKYSSSRLYVYLSIELPEFIAIQFYNKRVDIYLGTNLHPNFFLHPLSDFLPTTIRKDSTIIIPPFQMRKPHLREPQQPPQVTQQNDTKVETDYAWRQSSESLLYTDPSITQGFSMEKKTKLGKLEESKLQLDSLTAKFPPGLLEHWLQAI